MSTIEKIEKIVGSKIFAAYPYGSRVYGTHTYTSDYDYIVVADVKEDYTIHNRTDFDLTIYTPDSFQKKLHEHRVFAMECFFLPEDQKLREDIKWEFNLHLPTLRGAISKKVSHSWVKARKKIDVEDDWWTAVKSIAHSFRILDFGIQIAKHGRIVDYSSKNHILKEATKLEKKWRVWDKRFRVRHNQMMTEFRKLAPKE